MEVFDLKVKKREQTGKGYAKRVRRTGVIPGVMYDHGKETVSLEVPKKELCRLVQSHADENLLINVIIDDAPGRTALINELQTHPVSDEILHVDFKGVAMDEKIQVQVSVHETGESIGVKKGGVLDHAHREVTVECLPTNIPSHIDVDISELDIGKSIHVSEIAFPAGVSCLDDAEQVLFTVLPPKVAEAEAAEEVAEEAAAEPEVIKKGKEEETPEE